VIKSILSDHHSTDNSDVRLCLDRIKSDIEFDTSLEAILDDYWIIGVGENKEVQKVDYQYVDDWRRAVNNIEDALKKKVIILQINLGVQKNEKGNILPSKEVMFTFMICSYH